MRVARELRSGTAWINDWGKVYDEFKEGDYRQSGLGRLNGVASINCFIEYKHISLSTAPARSVAFSSQLGQPYTDGVDPGGAGGSRAGWEGSILGVSDSPAWKIVRPT
jgi:hypothetical protein